MEDRAEDERDRLSVGQLAAAAGMTAKALRHYDRIGLFAPDDVDGDTGYRWYGPDRVPQARLIGRLRSVGVPLESIPECLATARDPDVVDRVLAEHRRRLESRLTRVRGDLHRLAHLVADDREDDMTTPTAPADLPVLSPTAPAPSAPDERRLAVDLFNGVWQLLETENRTRAQDDRMLHMAHASRYHWEQVGTAVHLARGEWQCARVYAVLGRAEPARHHARRVLEICEENGIGDWDLAFAHEALARAAAVVGDAAALRRHLADAQAAAEHITDPDDCALLESDLQTIGDAAAPAS